MKCYHTDEPWHYAKWKRPVTKGQMPTYRTSLEWSDSETKQKGGCRGVRGGDRAVSLPWEQFVWGDDNILDMGAGNGLIQCQCISCPRTAHLTLVTQEHFTLHVFPVQGGAGRRAGRPPGSRAASPALCPWTYPAGQAPAGRAVSSLRKPWCARPAMELDSMACATDTHVIYWLSKPPAWGDGLSVGRPQQKQHLLEEWDCAIQWGSTVSLHIAGPEKTKIPSTVSMNAHCFHTIVKLKIPK